MTSEQFDAMRDFLRARVNELTATQMLVDVDFMRRMLGVAEPAPAPAVPVETDTPAEDASAVEVSEPAELPRPTRRKR